MDLKLVEVIVGSRRLIKDATTLGGVLEAVVLRGPVGAAEGEAGGALTDQRPVMGDATGVLDHGETLRGIAAALVEHLAAGIETFVVDNLALASHVGAAVEHHERLGREVLSTGALNDAFDSHHAIPFLG